MNSLENGKYTAPIIPPVRGEAEEVIFHADKFTIRLKDGRSLTLPVSWSPALAGATPEQRRNYVFVGGGVGIYWPDVDEDLSVRRLMVPDGEPYCG